MREINDILSYALIYSGFKNEVFLDLFEKQISLLTDVIDTVKEKVEIK